MSIDKLNKITDKFVDKIEPILIEMIGEVRGLSTASGDDHDEENCNNVHYVVMNTICNILRGYFVWMIEMHHEDAQMMEMFPRISLENLLETCKKEVASHFDKKNNLQKHSYNLSNARH